MNPPPRPAHAFQAGEGVSGEAAARQLLAILALWCEPPLAFRGDAEGEVSLALQTDAHVALAFASNLGAGEIDIFLDADGWLRAEVLVDGAPPLRVWIEDPYEEKEGWPDGADGVGEAPLRISKRGTWLNIDCARFPGVPAGQHGLFQLEDATP
jgi:hypothetical protein